MDLVTFLGAPFGWKLFVGPHFGLHVVIIVGFDEVLAIVFRVPTVAIETGLIIARCGIDCLRLNLFALTQHDGRPCDCAFSSGSARMHT